jgi:23S rRNA pseudouridine1911/1915/1917 synthase
MKLTDSAILYHDNHLLVVDKPSDVATQPDLTEMAKAWIKHKYHKPGAVFLHPIHRLDKPVSGLVLFARTSKALSRLQEQMREQKIEKTYLAWIEGEAPKEEGTLIHRLEHGSFKAVLSSKGKEAKLSYKVVQKKEGLTLLEIHLVTGRYHQIRAQFAAIGCPIVGDAKYGSRHSWPKGIALIHVQMKLTHPVTRVVMEVRKKVYEKWC